MRILKNERTRLAFRFGRMSALRSSSDVIDQLQAQLAAERERHRRILADKEKEIAVLIRDLMRAQFDGSMSYGRRFRQRAEPVSDEALGDRWLPQTTYERCVDVQAVFRRRRYQPRRPPLAKIRPGRPAPATGPGTTDSPILVTVR